MVGQVNCKSTGAIVGQQPFGGSRASGTNDKAGAGSYLVSLAIFIPADITLMSSQLRFVSIQSVKEASTPLNDWRYPHMLPDLKE